MSDIGLRLDGLLAFIVAAGLALILVLVIGVGILVSWLQARRKQERISHQPLLPHMVGMSLSLFCFANVLLLLLLTESAPAPRDPGIWLDRWVWAWPIAVLGLWPLTAFVWRRVRPN